MSDKKVIELNEDSAGSNEPEKIVELGAEEQFSVISLFFDQINLKNSFKKIISKTPIKITDQSIDSFILMCFLAYVFYNAGVLSFELSPSTWPLIIIAVVMSIELIAINTTILKRFLVEDMRTKAFIDKIPYMDIREVKDENKYRNFSSKCMDYFLRLIEKDEDKFPPYFIVLVLKTQQLRPKNLDLLFGTDIIKNIRPDMIIKILYNYRDYLSKGNILNIYEEYGNNDDVIKVLFATQTNSYYLVQNLSGKSKLAEYYKKYQINHQHIDWLLKIVRILFKVFDNILLRVLVYSFIIASIFGEYMSTDAKIISVLFVGLFFVVLFEIIVISPTLRLISKFNYNHYINNIFNI